jgi:hypothetical protein
MLFAPNIKPLVPMTTFEKCKKSIRKNPTLEIEFRLGKKTATRFDTNIGQDLFTKITSTLDKYTEWESTTETDESVYYKDDYRIIINNVTDESTHQTKKKVETLDFKLEGKLLDMRLAISKEEPCENRECDMDREVRRTRKSYLRKGTRIDCTIVDGPSSDLDSETTKEYQVEVELIGVPASDSELYNKVHKVMNLLSVLDQ